VSTTLDDRRIAEWLFLLTFAAAAYFYGGAGWSQNATFDVTRAIVERHTFAIDAYAANTGDRAFANGHVYANKAPALAVLAAIPYAPLHAILGTPQNAIALAVASYLYTLLTVGIFAALIPALLYLHARRNGVDSLWAATVAITIAFATELLPYSTVMMFTLPSGALMLIAYTSRRPEAGGFAAGLATAMNYLCAPAILFFSFRRGWRFIAGAAPPLIALDAKFSIAPPYGVDTYFLLTTDEPLADPSILQWDGVRGPMPQTKTALERLLALTGSTERAGHVVTPATWSIERIVIESVRPGRGRPKAG